MAESASAPPYPLVRRIVTGHTSNGDAVIESDVQLKPLNPFNPTETATAEQIGFVNLWRTTSYPAELQDAWTEAHGADTQIPLADSVGTIARIVDFPLGPGVMHRTLSIDFGILLEGEVELDLGEGVKTLLKKHDVVVQRGTVHAWHNVGLVAARMMFVQMPAVAVKIGGKELEPVGVLEEPEE